MEGSHGKHPLSTSIPPSVPWHRCDAPLRSRAAGDGWAGGTGRSPLHPQAHSRCRYLSQILAAPAQSNTSDGTGQLIIDGRFETLSAARPWSRGARGAGQEGEAGEEEGARPAHPDAAFCICHPQAVFPGYLLPNAQSPQRPAQASPLPRIRRSLIPKLKSPESWSRVIRRCAAAVSPQPRQAWCPTPGGCQHPRDKATGIWGSCCSPLGQICQGRTWAEGGSALPCRITAPESTACAAAAGFANAAA